MLVRQVLGTINSIQYYDYYFEEPTIIGFPTSTGVGNAISYAFSFAISSNSSEGDAVWEFVRTFYLAEYCEECDMEMVFPINAEALEMKFSSPEEEAFSITVGSPDEDGYYQMNITEPTEYDVERVRELIYSLDRVYRSDTDLYGIVYEEAESYFSGSKSLDEVVRIIRNKAESYVNERI